MQGVGDAEARAVTREADVRGIGRRKIDLCNEVPAVAGGALVKYCGRDDLSVGNDLAGDIFAPGGGGGRSGGPPDINAVSVGGGDVEIPAGLACQVI